MSNAEESPKHLVDCSPRGSASGMSPPVSPSSAKPFRLPGRRQRTISESERILSGPSFTGRVTTFCRQKGHGFVQPSDGSEPLFMHISDIDGDVVPKEGDEVSFKKSLVPPKNEKYAAVHVHIVHPAPLTHEKWDKEALEKGNDADS
jgi:cold shock CspA family protein